jgi:hypothetical protein
MATTRAGELIREVEAAGYEPLERDVVDEIVARKDEAVPLLVEVLRSDVDDTFLSRALALLGETGNVELLPEIANFFPEDEEDEDAVSDAADWAFRRIAHRFPEETVRAIAQMAETADAFLLTKLGEHLSAMPPAPGRKETLLGFGQRFADLDDAGRTALAVAMITGAMFVEGPGSPFAEEVRRDVLVYVPKEVHTAIRQTEAELRRIGYKPGADAGEDDDIYALCCEGFDRERPPDVPYVREEPKIGRNDPCWCGSGKKYKKCHLADDEAQ